MGVQVLSSWYRVYGGELPDVGGVTLFVVFIGSTLTSTIPGISVAGASPEATLYTPVLDVEYLLTGRPLTLNVIPVTPTGIPTPALLSRVSLGLLRLPTLVVDTGSYAKPRIPHVRLPSATIGGRVDSGMALPRGTSKLLFEEARLLGSSLARGLNVVMVGESMPGGTTTAMAIMEALGYRARGRVSSANKVNPHELKVRVVEEGFRRAGIKPPLDDVFEVVDLVGDPLHVSIAGFTLGAIEAGSHVILAGGTQMCSVLAILSKLNVQLEGRVSVFTTRWLIEDRSSDMVGLLREVAPGVTLAASTLNLSRSKHQGLRAYEDGYVKEGVGAGGLLTLLALRGYDEDEVVKLIDVEYERLIGHGVS